MDQQVINVLRAHLNALLDDLEDALVPTNGTAPQPADRENEPPNGTIPNGWKYLESREGETYSWPANVESYDPFHLYEGRSANGEISRYAIGRCGRTKVWGRDRLYSIVFLLGTGGGS